jgi:aristolochene synthase
LSDWFDHHSFEENATIVSRLSAALADPSSFTSTTNIESMHESLFRRILAVGSDWGRERDVLDAYMQMLACHCDSDRGATSSLHDYLVFREVDVGMPICMALLYWTEDIALNREEIAALEPLEHVANYHVSILNDIFSFEREWKAAQTLGSGAALVNGVRILADEISVSTQAAKCLCFALVRTWEVEFRRMAKEILESSVLKDRELMGRVITGIERRMTGAEEFSWRTKRYL